MKIEPPKIPETTTDQILLVFTLIVFGIACTMLSMGYQERKIPPEFEKTALFISGGVFGALAAKRLSV